jgi:sec-independent protein translocase protein TatA
MGALQPWHWVVIIIVILLLFGGRLIPRLGRSLGRSISGLKQGVKSGSEEFKSAVSEKPGSDTSASAESGVAKSEKDEGSAEDR